MSFSRSRYFGRDYNGVALRYDSCDRRILRLFIAAQTQRGRDSRCPYTTPRNRPRKGRIFIRMDVDAIDGGCASKGQGRVHVFFVQYPRAISPDRKGTHRGGGGRGVGRCAADDHHADSEGHEYVTRIATMMPLYRGKRRDISDEVYDLCDRFDLLRCETRTSASFAD